MAYPGLQWMKMEIPFAAGLQQQTDDRARPQPFLDICKDAQFEEVGGLQTRLPYTAMSNSIFGGGTLSSCRRLAVVNNELCVFTDTALYSWNAQLAKWVLRGTHLAVKVDETPRFTTTGDQIDGDRAELAGTVVYAWTEGTQVYAAAMDKTTGSVLVSPTAVSTAIGRPRLVALATVILLFVEASTTLLTVRAIDPAAPGTAIAGAGTTVLATDFNLYYDVVRAGTQDLCVGACRRQTTTSYTVFKVTPALAVTTSTKARTCDGPIAVSTIPDGTQTQVVRANSTNIQGDLLTTSTLADVFTAQAIGTAAGTPVNQIAAAFASTTCTAFWSAEESTGAAFFSTKANTVTTSNVIGAQAQFINELGVASRAFEVGGSIYVWLVFACDSTAAGVGGLVGVRAQLQNTYVLYRSDGHLVSKAAFDAAGGYSPAIGHLPGVALAGTSYAWAGARRRTIDLGSPDQTGFGARSLLDIQTTFDSNTARRTAQLGRTLYLGGGAIMQYDGIGIFEVGFLTYPWSFAGSAVIGGGGAAIPAGTYTYKGTLRWVNGAGEQERSTTATGTSVLFSSTGKAALSVFPLTTTRKTATPPAIEIWRTVAAAPPDAPFYLVTSKDPTATGDNKYIANSQPGVIVTLDDNFTDAILTTKEANPENGGFLEALAPPGANIVIATDTRLFLAGVAGDPDRVWPSRERDDGEVASFHDGLPINVPRVGGDITAIWFQDETLYVSRQTALYVLPGDGVDNNGQGLGFGPARIVSLDVGAVSQESVALTPLGTVFLSRKGWQLLTRGGGLQYIGGPVADYNSETVCSVDVVESQHQVRILTTQRMIGWTYPRPDFPGGQWGEWTISDGVHSLMWNGTHVYLTATGPKQQQSTYTGTAYGMDVETAWIKPNGLMGAAACRRLQPFGEYRSAFLLRMRIAYNYDPTYIEDFVWTPSPTTVGGPLQMMHAPKRPKCESIKVRLTAVTESVRAALNTNTSGMGVLTSGTVWTAVWSAISTKPGEMGNTVTLQLVFELGANLVDVRDQFSFSGGAWTPLANRIGVRVVCQPGSLTVAALEAAIAAGTGLATLTTPDATPTKTIDVAALAGMSTAGAFTGGAYGVPTGEALKLTGLGLEVGVSKATLYTGLSTAQKA